MKTLVLALWILLLALPVRAQVEEAPLVDDTAAQLDSQERERIRQTRAREQAQFTAQEAQCYARFAVNDCLADVRGRRREVLGDLRRQEVSLNDAQRKRRASQQILRSDARAVRSP